VGTLLVTKSHCSCLVLPVLSIRGFVLIKIDCRRLSKMSKMSRIIEVLSKIDYRSFVEVLKTVKLVGQRMYVHVCPMVSIPSDECCCPRRVFVSFSFLS